MTTHPLRLATFLALATACISGFNTFLAKIVVSGINDPIFFTMLKNAIVAVFLVGILVAWKKGGEIRDLSVKQWMKLAVVGVVGGFIPFALFFTGITHTSAINAALIHKTLFLWVALLAVPLLKEKIGTWQWAGIVLLFAANFFVGGFTGFTWNGGELMIAAATLFWAAETIIVKYALKDISSQVLAGGRMIIGSFLLYVLVAFQGHAGMLFDLSLAQWGGTILTSILLTGYVLSWYGALAHAPASYVTSILVVGALITNVLSAIFVTHAFPLVAAISSVLYVVGMLAVIVFAKKTADEIPVTAKQKKVLS